VVGDHGPQELRAPAGEPANHGTPQTAHTVIVPEPVEAIDVNVTIQSEGPFGWLLTGMTPPRSCCLGCDWLRREILREAGGALTLGRETSLSRAPRTSGLDKVWQREPFPLLRVKSGSFGPFWDRLATPTSPRCVQKSAELCGSWVWRALRPLEVRISPPPPCKFSGLRLLGH